MTTNSDWEIFKVIKEKALDRYCERSLENVEKMIWNSKASNQQRFHDLFDLMQESNVKLGDIFDGHSQSKAYFQLLLMRREGLVEDEELEGLTEEILAFSDPDKDLK